MLITKEGCITLLKRILITLGIVFFVRLGSYIPVPGLDPKLLSLSVQTNAVAQNFFNNFSDKNTFIIGLFTLSIFPYINGAIFVQLIITFSPSLAKLQKEKDLSSQRTIIRLTRIITLIWAIIQSTSIAFYFKPANWNFSFFFQTIIWLTTGAMIIVWFSEIITDYGLGNGPSIFIFTNIAGNFPKISRVFTLEVIEKVSPSLRVSIICLILFSLFGFILLQSGTRKLTLISSRELDTEFFESSQKINNFIPLKLNQAGIIPIILTTTALFLPNYISNNLEFSFTWSWLSEISVENLKIISNIFYWSSYFWFILTFSSFYATISLNPKDIADQLQRTSVTISGCRPGLPTTFYLKRVMERLNLLGSSILAILATLPNVIESLLNVSSVGGLSATSLLIMVGVIVDVLKEVDDIIYSSIYTTE